MAVATFLQSSYTGLSGSAYPLAIDGDIAVAARLIDCFAPHAQASPTMTVALDAGWLLSGTTLTEVATQSTGTITAPTTHPRIDRVVVDGTTGVVAVVTGTEATSPVAPAIPSGKIPVARALLQTTSTSITNSMLTDERALWSVGGGGSGSVTSVATGTGLTGGPITATGTIALATIANDTLLANTGGSTAAPSATAINALTAIGTATVTTSTATITPGNNTQFNVALQANVTLTIASGAVDGQGLRLRLAQDATGSRTVGFDSSVLFGADINSFTASTTANKVDVVGLIWDATKSKWLFVAYARGF